MEARLFETGDYACVAEWWFHHGKNPEPLWSLPPLGMIVPGIAAAWVFEAPLRLGGTMCFLEDLVCNPSVRGRERNAGVDAVMSGLLREAQARGGKWVRSITRDWPVLWLVKRHGYTVRPERFWTMGRPLGE